MKKIITDAEKIFLKNPSGFFRNVWLIFETKSPEYENMMQLADIYKTISYKGDSYATLPAEDKKFCEGCDEAIRWAIEQVENKSAKVSYIAQILTRIMPGYSPLLEKLAKSLPHEGALFETAYHVIQNSEKKHSKKTITILAENALLCRPTPDEMNRLYHALPRTSKIRSTIVEKLTELAKKSSK